MSDFQLSKRAQVSAAQKTAESLFKIIQFLFFRVPQKSRQKFLSRLRGKVLRIHPGTIGIKKMPPSAAIGQGISLTKNLLSGLNPAFVQQVLAELTRLLTTNIGRQPLSPPGAEKPK
jgi:hypothetical protein